MVYEELDPGDKDWYLYFHDEISGNLVILTADSSEEIRFRDDAGEDFLYWLVVVSGEPWYVFPGDSCLLWARKEAV